MNEEQKPLQLTFD